MDSMLEKIPNPLPQAEQNKPRESTVRREVLLDRIHTKVLRMIDLNETVQDHMGETPEVFRAAVQQALERITAAVPPELLVKVKRMNELFEVVEKRRAKPYVELSDEQEEADAALYSEFNDLMNNVDVMFLVEIERWCKSMVSKQEDVDIGKDLYEHDPKSFQQRYFSRTSLKKVDLDKMHIEFSGIHINCFVDQDEYKRIAGRDTAGLHFKNTPINLIVEPDDEGFIQMHEENHNVFESFDPPHQYHEQFILDLKRNVDALSKFDERTPTVLVDARKKSVKQRISAYADKLTAETRADLRNMFEGDITGFLGHFLRSYRALVTFKKTLRSEQRDLVDQAMVQLEETVVGFLNRLKVLVAAALRVGKEKELQAALALLGSKKMDHIEAYMRRLDPLIDADAFFYPFKPGNGFFDFEEATGGKFGFFSDRDGAKEVYALGQALESDALQDWTMEALNKVNAGFAAHPEAAKAFFSDKEKKSFAEWIMRLDFSDVSKYQPDLLTIGGLAAYDAAWRQLSLHIDAPQIADFVNKKVLYHITSDACSIAIKTKNVSLLDDLIGSGVFPKDEVVTAVQDHAREGFAFDDFADVDMDVTDETIKDTAFGQWMAKHGIS